MVQYQHYLVRERVHVQTEENLIEQKVDDEPLGITTFAFIKDPPTYMSLPSAREGFLNTIIYSFQPLTQTQFESYIELKLFSVIDSDKFVLPKDEFDKSIP